uniref:Metallothionein n=1 Tax=Anguilla anguilla TaxID=7936 RepID=A0A0E9TWD9_ANGAN
MCIFIRACMQMCVCVSVNVCVSGCICKYCECKSVFL